MLRIDPEYALPKLRAVFDRATPEELLRYSYEETSPNRRDLIDPLHALAGYSDLFADAEAILYRLSRIEAPSHYSNRAVTTWKSLFGAWFDNTNTPLDERLDLLEERIKFGDEKDLELAVHATANPFPRTGMIVPSRRIGGRARANPDRIDREAVLLARRRVPDLLRTILDRATPDVLEQLGEAWTTGVFEWTETLGSPEDLLPVLGHPRFPKAARNKIAVMLEDSSTRNGPDNPRSQSISKVAAALAKFDGVGFLVHSVLGREARSGRRRDEARWLAGARKLAEMYVTDRSSRGDIDSRIYGDEWVDIFAFGKVLGAVVTEEVLDHLWALTIETQKTGFLVATLSAAIESGLVDRGQIRGKARTFASAFPNVGVDVLTFAVDFDEGLLFALELFRSGQIDLRVIRSAAISPEKLKKTTRDLIVKYVDRAARVGSKSASVALVDCLGTWARLDKRGRSIFAKNYVGPALRALAATASDGGVDDYDWIEFARYLAKYDGRKVLQIATSVWLRTGYGRPDRLVEGLADAINSNSKPYFEAIFKLLGRRDFLLKHMGAQLTPLFTVGDSEELRLQLVAHPRMRKTVAFHLPSPVIEEGTVALPPASRVFFELVPPGSANFEECLGYFFGSSTYVGVLSGYGFEVFEEKKQLGLSAIGNPDPVLHAWGLLMVRWAEAQLARAQRDYDLDHAPGGRYGSNED